MFCMQLFCFSKRGVPEERCCLSTVFGQRGSVVTQPQAIFGQSASARGDRVARFHDDLCAVRRAM